MQDLGNSMSEMSSLLKKLAADTNDDHNFTFYNDSIKSLTDEDEFEYDDYEHFDHHGKRCLTVEFDYLKLWPHLVEYIQLDYNCN